MDKQKLIKELFVGKVSDILGHEKTRELLKEATDAINAIHVGQKLPIQNVSVSLPHESQIEAALDKLIIIRGEHPTRVRNPLYGAERQLAIDLVKYVILSNGPSIKSGGE